MPDHTRPIVPDGMLAGKVTIIAGASQGIGEAAAFGFARAGAIIALGARRAAMVEDHAERIRADGGQAIAMEMDVADEEHHRRLVERVMNEFGRLDCAFNNAGVDQPPAPLEQLELDEWRRVFAVKADGTFLGVKYQGPAIRASGGGSIVNHGSVVGDRGIATLAAPCSSQAAIVGLTKSAAKAFGPTVRVNMLATGAIKTPERAEMYPDEMPNLPAGRPGTPEECAAVAAWLLSDYSSYQTGAVIPVDGGYWA
jgi:NAD(P)-dependent dehydrogenase (short-subunit alcohol dehydrogenase family)